MIDIVFMTIIKINPDLLSLNTYGISNATLGVILAIFIKLMSICGLLLENVFEEDKEMINILYVVCVLGILITLSFFFMDPNYLNQKPEEYVPSHCMFCGADW